ncbi:hypothetical protein NE237_032309 [Protea cynaroides]|uniref:Caffeoyl-CoA O-methyltransferase n=1 Tax=Protea cynaroides TaxID=273540 RepID=A0A9Q0L2V8_9MAGN|nr:hypothetical protein NE237_032309 [Protea cynaroides]
MLLSPMSLLSMAENGIMGNMTSQNLATAKSVRRGEETIKTVAKSIDTQIMEKGPENRESQKINKGLLQTDELYQYILETSAYPREAEPLKEIRNATANHPKRLMATAPDAGLLISLLLKLVNAKKTIEIGVFTGYSLLLTALSITADGKIVAIDISREGYEIGLPIIQKAGVEHKIDFIEAPGLLVLDKLLEDVQSEEEDSFDFAYVDADKDNYKNYHEKLMKLVRVGGIIIYDNTLCGGTVALPESVVPENKKFIRKHIIEFNELLSKDPRIQISQIPVGDGVTICRRL